LPTSTEVKICGTLLPLAAHTFMECFKALYQNVPLAPLSSASNKTMMENLYIADICTIMIEVRCIKLPFYKEFIIVNKMPITFTMVSHV
jgi:hypothetical protein